MLTFFLFFIFRFKRLFTNFVPVFTIIVQAIKA